jgi:hypothetical protein
MYLLKLKYEEVNMKKLPIGLSTLKKIRDDGYLYIDKTHHVANMVNNGVYYFLSRPRRFGKSLFVDTLKQAFLGDKEVFTGLYLENNWDWGVKYPVIHMDFGEGVVRNILEFEAKVSNILDVYYTNYSIAIKYSELSSKFVYLIDSISH